MSKLPEEVQKIIKEVALEYEQRGAVALDTRQIKGLENLKKSGATVKSLDESVRQRWAQSLAKFPDSMAQDANGRDMQVLKFCEAISVKSIRADMNGPFNTRFWIKEIKYLTPL